MSWRNVGFLPLTGKIGRADGVVEGLEGCGVEVLIERNDDHQKCQEPVE